MTFLSNSGSDFIDTPPLKGLAVAEYRSDQPKACVICVHGTLDRGGSFARLARHLDGYGFDVVSYDRRGYQGSRDLEPVDFTHHVEDLEALIDREEPRQKVILFGHSFGGMVTLGAACRKSPAVSLVVNYESPMSWVLPRGGVPLPSDDPPIDVEGFFRRLVSDEAWERLSEPQREARRLDQPALIRDLAAARSEVPCDVATLRVPLTYMYGGRSQLEHYRKLATELVKLNPAIQTVGLEEADHGAHLTNSSQLATIIQRRWEELSASA
jgi:pimeloyl-ACP methyl ester carboxylesterase